MDPGGSTGPEAIRLACPALEAFANCARPQSDPLAVPVPEATPCRARHTAMRMTPCLPSPLRTGPNSPIRWDAAAQAHAASEVAQSHEEAAEIYASGGAFAPDEARAAVAGLDARVLLLAGEVDSGPLPRIAADIAQLIPRAELVVQPGAGHYPWLDDPRRFTRTVATFLGQEPAGLAV